MIWFRKWWLKTLCILVHKWIWKDIICLWQSSVGDNRVEDLDIFGPFLWSFFGFANFVVGGIRHTGCEEKNAIRHDWKTCKFPDESEVCEVSWSNQKRLRGPEGCFLPLSSKCFIRVIEKRAQLLPHLHPLPRLCIFCPALFWLTMHTNPYLDVSALSAENTSIATSKILLKVCYKVQP